MTHSRLRSIFLLLPLLAPTTALAQFSGGIQGTVTDGQKAVVADAIVMLTNVQSGVAREATTTSEGVYRMTSLAPGSYRVEVVKPGFNNALRESVAIGVTETIRV